MKRTISFLITVLMGIGIVSAQSISDVIKDIDYGKPKTAIAAAQSLVSSHPKDSKAIYWYGQAILASSSSPEVIKQAHDLYQKAESDGINDAWILVGLGHVELLEGGDINSAKQKFEQAITASHTRKGNNAEILTAIGRANADNGAKNADPQYGIDKLKEASDLDKKDPAISVVLGLCYRRLGSEYGGQAVMAFMDAESRNAQYPVPYYQIGRIYLSQNNKDAFEENFQDAIKADPTYPLPYLSLFNYYSSRDTGKARDYLASYLKYSEKDPNNDFFYADFLFRLGRYNESLSKAQELLSSVGEKTIPRLNVLLAYNYQRLGDSVNARKFIDHYFEIAKPEDLQVYDFQLAIDIANMSPGNEDLTASYLQKEMDMDSTAAGKIKIADQIADLYAKAQKPDKSFEWQQKSFDLKPKADRQEVDYYNITLAAYHVKDFAKQLDYAQQYVTAFPEQANGYLLSVMAGKLLDSLKPGTSIPYLLQQIDFLKRHDSTSASSKKTIVQDYYRIMEYYNDTIKDYAQALIICDKILEQIPNDPDMLKIRAMIKANINKINRPRKPRR